MFRVQESGFAVQGLGSPSSTLTCTQGNYVKEREKDEVLVKRGRGRGRGVKKRGELFVVVVDVDVHVHVHVDLVVDLVVDGARYKPARMPPLSPRAPSSHNTPSPPSSPPCLCNSKHHTLSGLVSEPKIYGSNAPRFPTMPCTMVSGFTAHRLGDFRVRRATLALKRPA
jgi:hypothetical protein